MDLGQVGIWRRWRDGTDDLREIESLGFRALWVGGSPSPEQMRPFLEESTTLTVASGVVNVWRHDATEVAEGHRRLRSEFGDRFLLGIGIGHPEATSEYKKPLTKMREYLDALDAADPPVARDERLLAALGPKMLDLSAERSLGTHPYFTTAEHTRFARERVGDGPLVAPEVAVVLESDPEAARATAREFAATYLGLTNYTSALLRVGLTESDIADGGSDRLIDTVIPHGSAKEIAEAVRKHLDAGADHVSLQVLGGDRAGAYRALADALL
ncbi:MAG TPA: TIGR03620 family F420-dependent LLM class oxidoreductase [Thermoleophilaceae bacterium]|jgi:probable F420-dependent oxidoreductase